MKRFAALSKKYRIELALQATVKIKFPKKLIMRFANYFNKMLLNLGMFFNAIPVPRTTARNGSSAM